MKRDPLSDNAVCHVFTKSIAGYCIFRDDRDYARMINLIKYYRLEKPPTRFSAYITLKDQDLFFSKYCMTRDLLVDVIAYCVRPTHLHITLRQLGIPAEVQQRLFDPFYSTKAGGTGLGLPIAERIVEKHGGLLQYQTQPNRGTTFQVVLPAGNHHDSQDTHHRG